MGGAVSKEADWPGKEIFMDLCTNSYEQLFSLKGKKALITGGTSGLGRAIAAAFLAQGAKVAVCSRRPDQAQELSDAAAAEGLPFFAYKCDITDPEDVSRMMDELEGSLGAVDILVNSAGMNRLIAAEDYDDTAFSQVIDLK